MIYSDDLAAYLKARMLPDFPRGVSWLVGPILPERWGVGSGMAVVVSPAPGSGFDMEWAIDGRGWQVRCYGPQSRDPRVNDANVRAEKLAWAAEKALLSYTYPLVIANTRISRVQRFGSGPSPMAPDNAGRVSFVATYILDIPSGL